MAITHQAPNEYDRIPYRSKGFYRSSPVRMATVGTLFGLESIQMKKARILELGCSYGGNIIPFAVNFPQSKVVGVDLSKVQVDEGNRIIAEMGLKNIELKAMNMLDIDEKFGEFDFIICHGVFSWVPDIVKEHILKIVKTNLASNGLAYVSYNTYPGWKLNDILKDGMRFRVQSLLKNGETISHEDYTRFGLGMVEFLEQYADLDKGLKEKIQNLKNKDPYYLYHEYYEEFNDPIYFYQFAEKLKEKDLVHISDSNLLRSVLINFQESHQAIQRECKGDHIAVEQYLDFLNEVQFRSSIITHEKNRSQLILQNALRKDLMNGVYVRGLFSLKSDSEENANDSGGG
ncbi:cyclopropane fatty acyl phospholipid synthase [Actinobacillus seminis]|nr:class I SAM-dependent methyltransferase [Actinobacillus seminis]SUU38411.1 cyclopropane fatty acyl phospholipid synthase [Actinobacillus seminis]